MLRWLFKVVSAFFLLTAPLKASLFFGEVLYGETKVSTFIYEYENKNFIPVPIYNSLGFVRQAPLTDIPQCGQCVALEDVAEVQRNGINIQIFPFADFQQQTNRIQLSSIQSTLSGRSQQTWGAWTNYAATLGTSDTLFLDSHFSTPWGTLNARTTTTESDGLDLNDVQFIHENINDNYEIITGDINTSLLSWGGIYALTGVGYFSTDPFLNDIFNRSESLSINIDEYTELEILANGRTIYKGFQGAGQFAIDNINYGGLVDIEIRKDSQTAENYQFYFGQNPLPQGEINTNLAVGQFTQGPFRYDYGVAGDIKYGVTDDAWMSGSLLGSENNYIAGMTAGIQTYYGELQGGYAQSNQGEQFEFGYQFIANNLRLRATYVEDNNLDAISDRTITSVTAGYRFDLVNVNARYQKRNQQELVSLSAYANVGKFSINANIQHGEEETSFNLFFNYRLGKNTFANYSISNDDNRASITSNHSISNTQLSYTVSHSQQQGETVQASAGNQYISVNARSNLTRNDNRLTMLGSVLYTGNDIVFSSRRAQAIGIIGASGGGILLNNGANQVTDVKNGKSSAVALRPYVDNQVIVRPKDISMSLDNSNVKFSVGRTGAYKNTVSFISPGVRLMFEEGKKGDTLLVNDKSFSFFENVGFFVNNVATGDYDAIIEREGKVICTGTFVVKPTYSQQLLKCQSKSHPKNKVEKH